MPGSLRHQQLKRLKKEHIPAGLRHQKLKGRQGKRKHTRSSQGMKGGHARTRIRQVGGIARPTWAHSNLQEPHPKNLKSGRGAGAKTPSVPLTCIESRVIPPHPVHSAGWPSNGHGFPSPFRRTDDMQPEATKLHPHRTKRIVFSLRHRCGRMLGAVAVKELLYARGL